MITIKKHTDELAQQPRRVERATCPKCGVRVAVRLVYGVRILEYHHNPARGFADWCGGSDLVLDDVVQD